MRPIPLSHRQAVAAYDAELRRQTRLARLLATLYAVTSLKLALMFWEWLA